MLAAKTQTDQSWRFDGGFVLGLRQTIAANEHTCGATMSTSSNVASDSNAGEISSATEFSPGTLFSSRSPTPLNVMKKDTGTILIKSLFTMELKLELSIMSGLQNSFCKWKLMTSLLRQRETPGVEEDDESSFWHTASGSGSGQPKESSVDSPIAVDGYDNDDIGSDGDGASGDPGKRTRFEASVHTLRTIYDQLHSETKSMQTKLEELRQQEEDGEGFVKAQNEGKLLISVMYMRQSMKRQLRRAFDTWFFVNIRKSNSLTNVKKMGTALTMETHKTATRQFHIKSKLEQNETVGKAIECSHAFFRWKFATVKGILQEERSNGEKDRKKLFAALRELKAIFHGKIRRNKAITDASRSSGEKLAKQLNKLHTSLKQANGLNGTLFGLIDESGETVPVLLQP